ncbi:hypothetical protein EXIGLDRAFT_834438 [Exidia glandulosa HHB12029]|uniref:Uncharacterized protein n=1 Tax=Exidia glandulosa HHB12029 TaxID=1314781 RepID=A0A165JT21_EXIGL|nr:hypothetical protein EXIGLDRAFT_834438 [Exidia glandulosa HHB12029]
MTDSGPTPDYLEQYRVPCVPEVYYIPDFIELHQLQSTRMNTCLARRVLTPPTLADYDTVDPRNIPAVEYSNQERRARGPASSRVGPDPVTRLRESAKHGQPNHAIVNQYLAGHGIMVRNTHIKLHTPKPTIQPYEHADGPSNADSAVDRTTLVSLLLELRSLVITRSSLYTGHLHGIEERTQDVEWDGVKVANAHLVRAEEARTGGRIMREARMSLT